MVILRNHTRDVHTYHIIAPLWSSFYVCVCVGGGGGRGQQQQKYLLRGCGQARGGGACGTTRLVVVVSCRRCPCMCVGIMERRKIICWHLKKHLVWSPSQFASATRQLQLVLFHSHTHITERLCERYPHTYTHINKHQILIKETPTDTAAGLSLSPLAVDVGGIASTPLSCTHTHTHPPTQSSHQHTGLLRS